jgi:mono/diheme cytochrome c family protein
VLVLALMVVACVLVACGGANATTEAPAVNVPRPSNAGGPGLAIDLTGDATAGEQVFVDNCQRCHGSQGTGGIVNPAGEPTAPSLNPIDPGLVSADAKTFATNIALFIQNGSAPAGSNITEPMTAFGEVGNVTPQQIADVIAYVISLNK